MTPLDEARDPSTSADRLAELWKAAEARHGLDESVDEGKEKPTVDDLDEEGVEALQVCRAIVRNPNVDTKWLNTNTRFSVVNRPYLAYNPSWPFWLMSHDEQALELLWLELTSEIDDYFREHNGWEYVWVPEEKEDYADPTDLHGMYASLWDAFALAEPDLTMDAYWDKLQSVTEHWIWLDDDDVVQGTQMMLVKMTDKKPFELRFSMLETFAREQAARAIPYLHRLPSRLLDQHERMRRNEYRPLFLKLYRGEPLPPLDDEE